MRNEAYDFGQRLRKLRMEAKITQQELAEKLGVTEWSIKNYERNIQLPPVDKLEKMALLFRTSLDYLRNLEKRKPVYLDDLPRSTQIMILDIIKVIREEQQYRKGD